jgi:LDH2 family malate/lactate/ureidoglycolate dehydrogenase
MKMSYDQLYEASFTILTKLGAAEDEARKVSDSLVRANMRGIHTHGVKYLKMISERIKAGMINVPTEASILKGSQAVTLIDGRNGLGQAAAAMAMKLSMERAGEFGISITFVRNTNNIGFLSYYTMMAAAKDMIGICAGNAAASISLWGGMEPVLGSNPISVAFPTDSEYPLVMDLSVSNVARGKIREAERLNKSIPPTWAFGPDGEPTEDPVEALKGCLMPIGGPKGVALAIMVDLLCGLISGSKYSKDVKTFHKLVGATGVGAFFLAINPKEIIDPSLLKKLIGEYIVNIKDIKSAERVSKIYLPGEIENENEARSQKEGVEIDSGTIEMLNTFLDSLNCDLRIQ